MKYSFFDFINNLKPEKFFLAFALFFGTVFCILTPPFQVPDEPSHFFRAWHISQGSLMAKAENQRVGGYLPSSLEKISDPFLPIIYSAETFRKMPLGELFNKPLNNSDKKFVDFVNNAWHSPICYFPQALSIFILRVFNLPPLYIFYFARLFTLFCWALILYQAIKIMPVYKWLFALVALLPMSLFVNMSLSADVMTNAAVFLFIAFVFNLTYSETIVTSRQYIYLSILVFLLVSVKVVYAPFLLILFIIPKNKFLNDRNYYLKILFLFVLAGLTVLVWNRAVSRFYIPYSDYNPDFKDIATISRGANVPLQIKYILHNGFYFFNIFAASLVSQFELYFPGYIGCFGWLDTKLPNWIIYFSYLVILTVAILDGSKTFKIKARHKSLFALTFIIILFLVFLSQYLIWDAVGSNVITNIQGRYLIPVLPLFFMLFHTGVSRKIITAPLVVIFSFLSLGYSCYVLFIRYFSL